MHALVITSNPSSAQGEELLKALSQQLGLKRIRAERYMCQIANQHISRLVGRIQRVEVLVDQSLPLNGVPYEYQAHLAIRGEGLVKEREILSQLEEVLNSSGYSCQLLISGSSGEMGPAFPEI